MKKRIFLVGLVALAITPVAQAQEAKLSLAEISEYLNNLKTAKGSFTQINTDGSLGKGIFYLRRPGRMRFEYQGRDSALVVAGQGTLAIFDRKSNAGPQQYPLKRTPLHVILQEQVNLGQSNMVTAHSFDGTSTSITAQDPQHPEMGNVKLVFTNNPIELRQWVVTDEAGGKTTVVLGKLDTETQVPARLFDIAALIRSNEQMP
jgi:outer membrane lipoprotein-sorting protein